MPTEATAETAESADRPWHELTADAAARRLEVDPVAGLTGTEVEQRRSIHGPNRLVEATPEPEWRKFARQFAAFMQLMLLAAGVASLFINQVSTGVLLIVLAVVNAIMGYKQEGKAEAAVAALKEMLEVTARVRRDSTLIEVPADDLVPGDLVVIEAGDLVPADGRLLQAASLEIEESALTGESQPAAKSILPVDDPGAVVGDRLDMAYMNSLVTRGTGEFLVTATGMTTEVGRIAGMLASVQVAKSPLQGQMDDLAKQLAWIAGAAMVVVIGAGLARGLEFDELLLLGTAMAVAAIPTGLPTIVTTLLARGTQQMAAKGAIVKEISQVETLGTTSAICSDKTGTLTVNQMTARQLLYGGAEYSITGSGYEVSGQILYPGGRGDVPLEPALLPMALASDAVVDAGELVGDPTEGALVVLAGKGGLDVAATRRQFPRLAEVPFDSEYKLMATFHRMPAGGDGGDDVVRCYVKGAPDVLFARSARVQIRPDEIVPMDNLRERAADVNARMAGEGLRVLALGQRDFDPDEIDLGGDLLEVVEDLTLVALVGIVDPPRAEAGEAIAVAQRAGIEVRMITGDHAVTAAAIAGELGIEGEALTGAALDQLSDEEFDERVGGIGVFGRVAPEHKVRLVETLQRRGDVVAMTGDGVNDAPALKQADIGVAMGITGTEVSKQAASMILTDDNFATIVEAVHQGRAIYDNLMKYIRFQLIGLVGIILTYIGASILNISGGVPFTALQILWVNFAVTLGPALGLGFDKPSSGLMDRSPRPRNSKILDRRRGLLVGLLGTVMAAATLLVLEFGPGLAAAPETVTVAGSMALVTLSLAQGFDALSSRSERDTVFSRSTIESGRYLLLVLSPFVLSVLATEVGFLRQWLSTVPLTAPQWGVSLLAASSLLWVSEGWKAVSRRRDRAGSRTDASREFSAHGATT